MPSTKCCYAKEFSDRSRAWSPQGHYVLVGLGASPGEAVQFRTASPNIKQFKIEPQEAWFAQTGFGEATDRWNGANHVFSQQQRVQNLWMLP